MAAFEKTVYLAILTLGLFVIQTDSACQVPGHYRGSWFSYAGGIERNFIINEEGLSYDEKKFDGKCMGMRIDNSSYDGEGRFDSEILFFDSNSACYFCYQIFHRTPNILQYRKSSCETRNSDFEYNCDQINPMSDVATMFKKEINIVNCKTTFEGVYQFSYEVNFAGGGICDTDRSIIVACQEPGSPYVDNQVYDMQFGKCPEVSRSANERIRFQCMGSWRDPEGNIWAGIADLGREVWRERFRCLLTRDDQQQDRNLVRYTLSRWGTCESLKSPYEGDIRLVLQPALLTDPRYFVWGNQLQVPSCRLPRNFTGTWFTTGEYDSDVTINATHIYFRTKLDQFTYKETYFTCLQNRDTRFLMTAVTVGRCEVDYICFDFLPRHHSIVRWRMSKPYRLTSQERQIPDFLNRKFRQVCMWSSFTIDREDVKWKYNTFLLNPPAPIDCPIAGRYKYVESGPPEEKYYTRIRGITERPRHMIDCREYETVFESCSTNTKKIFIDAEYCATLDHTGRPIGEYDIPDRELNCVGYWMEDMRSYLITYDEEDPVSRFRCWVYERLDWRDIIISRASRSVCGKLQTAYSDTPVEGASLQMKLFENERLFDDCPQRFEEGKNPYIKPTIYVMEGAGSIQSSVILIVISSLFILFSVYH